MQLHCRGNPHPGKVKAKHGHRFGGMWHLWERNTKEWNLPSKTRIRKEEVRSVGGKKEEACVVFKASSHILIYTMGSSHFLHVFVSESAAHNFQLQSVWNFSYTEDVKCVFLTDVLLLNRVCLSELTEMPLCCSVCLCCLLGMFCGKRSVLHPFFSHSQWCFASTCYCKFWLQTWGVKDWKDCRKSQMCKTLSLKRGCT